MARMACKSSGSVIWGFILAKAFELTNTSFVEVAAALAQRVVFGTKDDQHLVDSIRTEEEVELPSMELLNAIEEIAVRKFPSSECRMKSSSLYATAFLLDAFAQYLLRPVVQRTEVEIPIIVPSATPARRQGLYYPIVYPRDALERRRKLRHRAERRSELESRLQAIRRAARGDTGEARSSARVLSTAEDLSWISRRDPEEMQARALQRMQTVNTLRAKSSLPPRNIISSPPPKGRGIRPESYNLFPSPPPFPPT